MTFYYFYSHFEHFVAYFSVKSDIILNFIHILSILVAYLRVMSDTLVTVTHILSIFVMYLRVERDILLLLLTF
jgi:hypothetical protein